MPGETKAPTLWGFHAAASEAEKLFLVHGYIGVGWTQMGDMGGLPDDREAIRAKVAIAYPEDPAGAISAYTGQIYRFLHVLTSGDLIAYRPQAPVLGKAYVFLGRVTGPYLYNPFLHDHYANVRRVEWLRSVPVDRFSQGALHELGSQLTLFHIDDHAAEFLAMIAESK